MHKVHKKKTKKKKQEKYTYQINETVILKQITNILKLVSI